MREIKFRGLSAARNEWIYGDLIHNRGRVYIADDDISGAAMIMGHTDFEVDGRTVGQYTELKDREGREIYEGDVLIMESPFGDYFGYVAHERGGYCMRVIEPNDWHEQLSVDDVLDMDLVDQHAALSPFWESEMRSMKMHPCGECAEIIGNVHTTERFKKMPALWDELYSIGDAMEEASSLSWDLAQSAKDTRDGESGSPGLK